MKQTLYIKFGTDSAYFEVEIEDIEPFSDEVIPNNERQKRAKWGTVLIKNKPYLYALNPQDKYKLYDLILAKDPTEYIFIKHVAENGDEIEGYFGVVDCEINDNQQKIIKVTPTILDQYTDFLENYDTKIDIYGASNLVYNGDFLLSSGGLPTGWNYLTGTGYDSPAIDTFLGKKAVTLYCKFDNPNFIGYQNIQSGISQLVGRARLRRNIDISFYYELIEYWNPHPARENLSVKIVLTDSFNTHYANANGEWVDDETEIIYSPNDLALPVENITNYKFFRIILDPPPLNGDLTIYFNHYVPTLAEGDSFDPENDASPIDNAFYEADLYITDVVVSVSDLAFDDITINLDSDNLVVKEQSEIQKESGVNYAQQFTAYPKKKAVVDYENDHETKYIEQYLDENNSPNFSFLQDDVNGMHDSSATNYYDMQFTIFATEVDNPFYLAELCEIEIFQGDPFGVPLFEKIPFSSIAKFAREEQYSTAVYTQEDEDLGNIPVGKHVGDYKYPELNVGWTETRVYDGLGMLWVRKPFNDSIDEWSSEGLVDSGGVNKFGFRYLRKIKTTKSYPQNGLVIKTAVDLRDMIERVIRGTHPSFRTSQVTSTFLWNDFPADASTNKLLAAISKLDADRTLNYYTLESNFLNNINALHTFDLKDVKSTSDNDAKLEISFKEFWDDFKIVFPYLEFIIDANLDFRIEHESFEDYINDFVDIAAIARNHEAWKYQKDKMYAIYDYFSANSGYKDFNYGAITFDKIVSNRRSIDLRETKTTKYISTDIQYCLENKNDLSNGMILLNYNEVNGVKILDKSTGKISGQDVPNGSLSLSNMLYKFGNYEGTWETGKVNGTNRAFTHTKYSKEALEKIELKGIYGENYFSTNIGIGFAITKEKDYKRNLTFVSLLYRYNDWYIIVETDNILEL